jgi:ethanolamine utilization microcompartment shell protein EutS
MDGGLEKKDEKNLTREQKEKVREFNKKNSENASKIRKEAIQTLEKMPIAIIDEYAKKLSLDFKDSKQSITWFPLSFDGNNFLIRIEKEKGITLINANPSREFHSSYSFKEKNLVTGEMKYAPKTAAFIRIDCATKEGKERLGSVEFFKLLLQMQMQNKLTSALKSKVQEKSKEQDSSDFSKDFSLKGLQLNDSHIYKGLAGFMQGKIVPSPNPVSYPALYLHHKICSLLFQDACFRSPFKKDTKFR